MEFEWDEAKNKSNITKHGIGFERASRIFDGPVLTYPDDGHYHDDQRSNSIGMLNNLVILLVVHTSRSGKTRIISARKATRHEREEFETTLFS